MLYIEGYVLVAYVFGEGDKFSENVKVKFFNVLQIHYVLIVTLLRDLI